MNTSPRKTRVQRKQQQLNIEETSWNPNLPVTVTGFTAARSTNISPKPVYHQAPNLASLTLQPMPIPSKPSLGITTLSLAEHRLLLRKQNLLLQQAPDLEATTPKDFRKHSSTVLSSTLVFARYESGTAVIIRQDGLILTCAHCVAETPAEFQAENAKDTIFWLLSSSGRVISAKCIAWDPIRDLSLLGVVSASESGPSPNVVSVASSTDGNEKSTGSRSAAAKTAMATMRKMVFSSVSLAENSPAVDAPLVCVGHPGSEDLETSHRGVKTGYDVLHVSTGAFRGTVEGQDVQDNEEIGALMHDCWTYWGHSGAPLLDRKTGKLVGLHSSWDDETGMRRGVAIEAIREFLRLCNIELGSWDKQTGS